jgi:hypothetical protein
MTKRTVWSILTVATSLAVQGPTHAQEHRGTMEQQLACTPDVFRLCGSEIPDENRIVACLRLNTAQLGDACRAVFEAKNSVPQEPSQRPRGTSRSGRIVNPPMELR